MPPSRNYGGQPTLSDVASAAGVSRATASRALSGSSTVRADLVARVTDAARRLDYQPNAVAQMTARGSSALIGIVADRLRETHVGAISAGVLEVADERGLTVMMSSGSAEVGTFTAAVRTMIGFRPRALIIATRREQLASLATDPIVLRYATTGGRLVSIGRSSASHWIPEVHLDDEAGALAVAGHVRAAGYQHPVILGVAGDFPAENLRAETLRRALDSWTDGPTPIVEASDLTHDGGYQAADTILSDYGTVDVILAVADELAVGSLAAIRDRHLPPDRVGVTGFDDLPQASVIVPALTTVDTQLRAAGRRAVTTALDDENIELGELHSRLVRRDSVRLVRDAQSKARS
ncbi:LacI family DNA-binding transcriptional regulator [Cryobacterium sp. AP23]